MHQRLNELDSLRGLAAFSVMIGHFVIVYPSFAHYTYGNDQYWLVNLFKYSPIHLFWSGHESVILFFILSGFVLSLPFYRNKRFIYSSYLIKRVTRIYIPYVCAVGLAFLLQTFFYSGKMKELSNWFNQVWTDDVSLTNIIEHLSLIVSFKNHLYDPVLWSLVQEMRISIIFPFVMFFILRFNWKWSLLIGLIMSYVASTVLYKKSTILSGLPNDYFLTLHYLLAFVIGALVAKHKEEISSWFRKKHISIRWSLLLLGVGFYISKWIFYDVKYVTQLFYNDLSISIGASIFIIAAISSKRISNVLAKRPIAFLGKISYSLYLYHALVLFTMIHLFGSHVPIPLLLIISVVISLMISAIAYRFIEKPAMKLGKYLTSKNSDTPSLLKQAG